MDKLREKKNIGLPVILPLAFLLPVAMLLLACLYTGKQPFGDGSFIVMDMQGQYAYFFSYFRSILSGENGFFYTFAKNLGGDMTGLTAYYLLSPLNLIFALFPLEELPMAVSLLICAKIGLCGVCSALYLYNRRQDALWVLVFSAGYALMSYNIAYASNVMWLDCVYMLPVIALGIERLVSGKGRGVYILSLAYAIVTNYYIGYMLCIFSLLFFVYTLLLSRAGHRDVAERPILSFLLSSLTAGALTAAVLLPAVLALSGTKAGADLSILRPHLSFYPNELLQKLFTRSVDGVYWNEHLPNIFCGLLTTALALLFFFNSRISRAQKLYTGAFMALLLLSFIVSTLNLIWHGLSFPACFPFRYSFMLSFLMVRAAFDCACVPEGVGPRGVLLAAVLIAAGAAGACIGDSSILSNADVALDLAATALLLAVIYFSTRHGARRRLFSLAAAAVQLLSLTWNATAIAAYSDTGAAAYAGQMRETLSAVQAVKALDSGLVRMEKDYYTSNNDPMLYGYNGLSHFSSTEKLDKLDFLRGFGFDSYTVWVRYGRGNTCTADALLGVKYLISDTGTKKPYNRLFCEGEKTVYENPYALPIAFMADEACLSELPAETNCFDYQQALFSAVSGDGAELFFAAECSGPSLNNLMADGCNYSLVDDGEAARMDFTVTAASGDPLYMYIPDAMREGLEIRLNGETVLNEVPVIWCLGSFETGEEICVSFVSHSDFKLTAPEFRHEDVKELGALCDGIRSRSAGVLERLSSSSLRWSGSTANGGTLLFTLPYENGWHITVDGETANAEKALGALTAVKLSSGEHIVELKYVPPGLYAGCSVSVAALAAFILLIRKNRKNARDN